MFQKMYQRKVLFKVTPASFGRKCLFIVIDELAMGPKDGFY
jgi:hypothetical protein